MWRPPIAFVLQNMFYRCGAKLSSGKKTSTVHATVSHLGLLTLQTPEIALRLEFTHHLGKFHPLTLTECHFEICYGTTKNLTAGMQSRIPLYLTCQCHSLIWAMTISRLLQLLGCQEQGPGHAWYHAWHKEGMFCSWWRIYWRKVADHGQGMGTWQCQEASCEAFSSSHLKCQSLREAALEPAQPTVERQISVHRRVSWGRETSGQRIDLPGAGSSHGRQWQGLDSARVTTTPSMPIKSSLGRWATRSAVNRAWCISLHGRALRKGIVRLPAQGVSSTGGCHFLRRSTAMVSTQWKAVSSGFSKMDVATQTELLGKHAAVQVSGCRICHW